MTFQLWDADSANLVGSYPSEEAALEVVRQAMQTHGGETIASLVLLRQNSRGRLSEIAEGSTLVDLAVARAAPSR